MARVYNKKTEEYEKAEACRCPGCNDCGGFAVAHGEPCKICSGVGYVIMSVGGSGWCRPKFSREANHSKTINCFEYYHSITRRAC